MDCKTITERLRRVAAIVDSWKDENGVPQIERDIALGELRDIYNALLVVDVDDAIASEEGVALTSREDDEIEVEVVIGSPEEDEDIAEESDDAAEDKSWLDNKSSFDAFYDALDIDALLGLNDAPAAESSEEADAATKEEAETEEPKTAETIEESVEESAEEPAEEQQPEQVVEPVVEPVVETASEPVAEEPKVVGAGLFDLNDIPVRSKSRRKMISLYSDNPLPVQTPAETVKVEPKVVERAPVEKAEPKAKAQPVVEVQPTAETVAPAPQQRLGDSFGEVKTLADKMAEDANPTTPFNRIKSLRQAIGLNDKFLMIRDLFNGDADRYEATIDTLDEFDDLDECIIYIVENFRWNPDLEAAKLLVSLIERKLA